MSEKENSYAPYGYDATWMLALALNYSIALLAKHNLSLSDVSYKSEQKHQLADILSKSVSSIRFYGMSVSHVTTCFKSTIRNLYKSYYLEMRWFNVRFACQWFQTGVCMCPVISFLRQETLPRLIKSWDNMRWTRTSMGYFDIYCWPVTHESLLTGGAQLYTHFRDCSAIPPTSPTFTVWSWIRLWRKEQMIRTLSSSAVYQRLCHVDES